MSLPHPTALTSIHAASLPHFLPSPALASPVGSSSSQPGVGVSNPPCSTLFVANLGQYVSEHELKEVFGRFVATYFNHFTFPDLLHFGGGLLTQSITWLVTNF